MSDIAGRIICEAYVTSGYLDRQPSLVGRVTAKASFVVVIEVTFSFGALVGAEIARNPLLVGRIILDNIGGATSLPVFPIVYRDTLLEVPLW